MTYHYINNTAVEVETKRPISQALTATRISMDVDFSKLRFGAPAKLRTCCRHGVGYGFSTTAGTAFAIIHAYLVPEGTNIAEWDQPNGIVRITNPADGVKAWALLQEPMQTWARARGREGIKTFRAMFKDLGGWNDDLKERALALTESRFAVTYSTTGKRYRLELSDVTLLD